MTQQQDPELVDDRDAFDGPDSLVDIPDYDDAQFELPLDYEYPEEEDGESDG